MLHEHTRKSCSSVLTKHATPGPTPSVPDSASASRFRHSASALELIGNSPYRKTDDLHVRAVAQRNVFDDDAIALHREQPRERRPEVLEDVDAMGRVRRAYQIVRQLGKGGYATVYEVVHLQSGASFAAKVFDRRKLPWGELQNIENEVALQSKLDHPNIVKVECLFSNDTHVIIILELCRKDSFYQLSKECGAFPPAKVRSLLCQLCSGVAYMHRHRLVHRDIKLGNLLVGLHGGELKIADFGFASHFDGASLTKTCGTPNYMAPEILSKQRYGPAVDVWSVGVTAYALAFGKPPFESVDTESTYARIRSGEYRFPAHHSMPGCFVELVKQMLCRDPLRRITALAALQSPFLATPVPRPRPAHVDVAGAVAPRALPGAIVVASGYCSKYGYCCQVHTVARGTLPVSLFNDNTKMLQHEHRLYYITRREVAQGMYTDERQVIDVSGGTAQLHPQVRKKLNILRLQGNRDACAVGAVDPNEVALFVARPTAGGAGDADDVVYVKNSDRQMLPDDGLLFSHRLSNDVFQATAHVTVSARSAIAVHVGGRPLAGAVALDVVLFGASSALVLVRCGAVREVLAVRDTTRQTSRGAAGSCVLHCDDGRDVSLSAELTDRLVESLRKVRAWSVVPCPFA